MYFAYFMQLMSAATEAALQRGYALVLVSGTGPTDAMLNSVSHAVLQTGNRPVLLVQREAAAG